MGRLRVTGNTPRPRKVMSTLGHRLNPATNTTVSCWMVQHNGGGLIDGHISDYLVDGDEVEPFSHKHNNIKATKELNENLTLNEDAETKGTTAAESEFTGLQSRNDVFK